MSYRLVLLSKSPKAGNVKTRMQPYLSPQESKQLHIALLQYNLARWREVMAIDLSIAGSIDDFKQQVLQPLDPFVCYPQVSGHLGLKMANAVTQSLALGAKGVLLVGGDCPFIDAHYLLQACQGLEHHDVVIGPAYDGGYVLLAMKQLQPSLFSALPWGSSCVFSSTLSLLIQQGLSYYLLPMLADIDRPCDLAQLAALPQAETLRGFSYLL